MYNQIKAGQLQALATTGAECSTAFPDTSTMQESGIEDFALTGWIGIFAPKDTPDEIIQKINSAYAFAMQDQRVQETLHQQGDIVATDSSTNFKDFLEESNQIWQSIAKSSNISLD